ncbi:hypothetical protein [Rhodoferax sp.]|uniref:hypothetical protein n=1 Tax=Rhodoferax sp. TaxID=50421 RepID=UPI003BB71118
MSLLIIDALNIIRRIHEAIPEPDSEEKVANTITSSLASFKRAIKTHRPSHSVVVFDHGDRTCKHELYAHYQANRKPMPPLLRDGLLSIKQALQHIGLHWIAIEGIEADDAIATLVEKWCQASPAQVTILSTDKDYLQLLNDQTRSVCMSTSRVFGVTRLMSWRNLLSTPRRWAICWRSWEMLWTAYQVWRRSAQKPPQNCCASMAIWSM